jgi:hypothetical protein
MKRRTVLGGIAGAGALTLGGCLGRNGDVPADADDTPSSTPTESPTSVPETTSSSGDSTPTESPPPTDARTPTATPTPATPDAVTDTALTVTETACGEKQDGAMVEWDRPDSTVTVNGAIWGNDGCYTATLSDVAYTDGVVTATVDATERDDTGETTACMQCILEIRYEATITFDHGLPSEVVVVHGHGDRETTVTTEGF